MKIVKWIGNEILFNKRDNQRRVKRKRFVFVLPTTSLIMRSIKASWIGKRWLVLLNLFFFRMPMVSQTILSENGDVWLYITTVVPPPPMYGEVLNFRMVPQRRHPAFILGNRHLDGRQPIIHPIISPNRYIRRAVLLKFTFRKYA